MNIIEKNYKTLEKMQFLASLRENSYVRYKRPGMKDLHLNKMRDDGKILHFSISHYDLDGGSLKADPDMEIIADWSKGIVKPLTYHDDFNETYKEIDESTMSNHDLVNELSHFLDNWLTKIGESQYVIANKR
ncbi:MAG: hypothetical protein JXK07_01620 [Spirochaetes bacterium]|nr:hypothetical protein [Spirochaetota bacterium]MBN2772272.1 hypothetical protein [Spirochaetota bacterium]